MLPEDAINHQEPDRIGRTVAVAAVSAISEIHADQWWLRESPLRGPARL